MVEQQLEGHEDADLVFTTLWAMPDLDLVSSFNFSSSLLSWFSSPMEANLDFFHSI
jgi:hypothetical protein